MTVQLTGARQALLIAGDVRWTNKHDRRHFNDLEEWAVALDRRGFDCTACVGDGTHPLNAPARTIAGRRRDILVAMNSLAACGEDDLAVMIVANHGTESGICCFHGAPVTPEDMQATFNDCCGLIVGVFGQCHAGVFSAVATALRRATLVGACTADERSHGDREHNEFLHRLLANWCSLPVDLRMAFSTTYLCSRSGREDPWLKDPQSYAGDLVL